MQLELDVYKTIQVDEMRAKLGAQFAMTVNIKCGNYQIRPERTENKVKQSTIVYYLVNPPEARENL